ncbi:MAG: hypothetical protein MI923_29150 [Phycisphaerales bacterium]|nr:hypothetical protein [Phycisphaerales bacterium]
MPRNILSLLIISATTGLLLTPAHGSDHCGPSIPPDGLPVFNVTDLGDDGQGTLRWAFDQCKSTAGCVIKGIPGVITLLSPLDLEGAKNVYIEGKGLQVGGQEVLISNCNGVSITDVRFVLGANGPTNNDSLLIRDSNNISVKHCTIVQGRDECLDIFRDCDCIVVEYCIIGDPIRPSPDGSIGACFLSDPALTGDVIMTHNLFGLANHRQPQIACNGCRVDMINNVSAGYSGGNNISISHVYSEAPRVNIINHYNHLNNEYRNNANKNALFSRDPQNLPYLENCSVYFDGIEGYQVDPLTHKDPNGPGFIRDKLFGSRDRSANNGQTQPSPNVLRSSPWDFIDPDIEIDPTLIALIDVYKSSGARPRGPLEQDFIDRAFDNIRDP